MTNHSSMKLGKLPRRHDRRTLRLAGYLAPALPPAPAQVDYTRGATQFGMMLNDQLGCCTIAAVGHAVQTWRMNSNGGGSIPPAIPDSTILQFYEQWDGYNPADPATDQGGVELDVLKDWRQQGFAGHTLDAFAAVDPGTGSGTRENLIRTAIWLFGGIYIGVELPLTAQNQDVWDVSADDADSQPGSWGGHAVYVVGYDTQAPAPIENRNSQIENDRGAQSPAPGTQNPGPGTLTCITWGAPKRMTWAWFEKYCSEAYALVSKDWLEASGVAPSGLDLEALENDLKLVTT